MPGRRTADSCALGFILRMVGSQGSDPTGLAARFYLEASNYVHGRELDFSSFHSLATCLRPYAIKLNEEVHDRTQS